MQTIIMDITQAFGEISICRKDSFVLYTKERNIKYGKLNKELTKTCQAMGRLDKCSIYN